MEKLYYVYELIDPRDGKVFYVGKGTGNRMYKHVGQVKKYKHKNLKLLNYISSIIQAKLDVVYNVVFKDSDENKCLDREIELIKYYGIDNLCNLTFGGGGLHVYFTPEVRKKMSDSKKGKKLPKSTCDKMSLSRSGEKNPFYGKTHTKEVRDMLSTCSKSRTGELHPRSRPIIQIEPVNGQIIKTWVNIAEVESSLGISNTHISSVCLKKRLTAGKFIWRYLEDYSVKEIEQAVKRINSSIPINAKKILQIDKNTGKVLKKWQSLTMASNAVNVTPSAILKACKDTTKSSAGFKWRYL